MRLVIWDAIAPIYDVIVMCLNATHWHLKRLMLEMFDIVYPLHNIMWLTDISVYITHQSRQPVRYYVQAVCT